LHDCASLGHGHPKCANPVAEECAQAEGKNGKNDDCQSNLKENRVDLAGGKARIEEEKEERKDRDC
jgi:hypothetical protein